MAKRVTIKDIAITAGVSLGTVHLALSDKTGVSDKTREKIRALAKEMDYHPNAVAASLKRRTLRLAACFPDMEGDNQFYYPQLWNGLNACQETLHDYNISMQKFEYPEGWREIRREGGKIPSLERLTELLDAGEVDGLILQGNRCPFMQEQLKHYVEQGLALALVDTDIPDSGRLCCVAADYDSIGRTMAELVLGRIPSCGSILMCAGKAEYPSHTLIVEGFEAYRKENGHNNLVYMEHSNHVSDQAYESILEHVKRPDVAAVCSVTSRSTIMLGRALEETGRVGKVMAVGSDLFEESKDFLRRGTFQNLVQKNPFAQAYMAEQFLTDYLLRDKMPEELFVVGSQIVFRSNLNLFEKNSVRFLE